jgi:hypothetical protein
LARSSLYRTFHDKRILFVAALQHSIQGLSQLISERLESAVPARTAIRKALTNAAHPPASDEDLQGSLIAVAVSELIRGVGRVVSPFVMGKLDSAFSRDAQVRHAPSAGASSIC